mgnify:CR=1 FL=1
MALLEAKNISFGYGGRPVLDHVSFSIEKGSLVSLLGPNGCGKTTLLKTLLGLLPVDGGEVLFEDRPICSYDRRDLARRLR